MEQCTIGKGNLLDVPSLLKWVIGYSHSGNFSADYQKLPSQIAFFRALFGAALRSQFRTNFDAPGSYLVVARKAGDTVGAALIHCRQSPIYGYDVELSHLAVDPDMHGEGIGKLMLNYLQQNLPHKKRLWCYCTPFSRPMINNLTKAHFRIKKVARLIKGNILLPHRFEQIST